ARALGQVAAEDHGIALLVDALERAQQDDVPVVLSDRRHALLTDHAADDADGKLDADHRHLGPALAEELAIDVERRLAIELEQHVAVDDLGRGPGRADASPAAARRRRDLDGPTQRDADDRPAQTLVVVQLVGALELGVVGRHAADDREPLTQYA